MNRCMEVIESFEITGRGLVVVLPVLASELPHTAPLSVTVRAPGQLPFQAQALHEILLRRSTPALESSAFLLTGLRKSQVPLGSIVEFQSNAA